MKNVANMVQRLLRVKLDVNTILLCLKKKKAEVSLNSSYALVLLKWDLKSLWGIVFGVFFGGGGDVFLPSS